MQAITIYDYLLLPIYVLLLYMLVYRKSKKYVGTGVRKFFIVAFFLRIAGSVLYSMVVQYYYGYGDSLVYYEGGTFIRKMMSESPDFTSNLFMSGEYLSGLAGKNDINSYTVGTMANTANIMIMKISAVLSYLSFNYYLIISLFFAFFSFIGTWRLFCTFNDVLGKRSEKLLAYAVLYVPSLWFWGSGLIKESICMGALGLAVSILYRSFVKKKISIKDILLLILNLYLLYTIKNYIAGILLASLAASLIAYVIVTREGFFSKLVTIITTLALGVAIFSLTVAKYLETMVEESAAFIETSKMVYALEDDERSAGGFAAGDFDLSLQGFILKAPSAVFTTLFRPFIWETRKPMMLFSALESLLMLGVTIFLLFKFGVFRFFSIILSNPYLIFCLIFCILMGAVVGLTTFNFGTVVRYRLPLLPFFGFLMIATYIIGNSKKKAVEMKG